MKCFDCGVDCVRIQGDISINDKFIGPYITKDVVYYKCEVCGEHLFPAETSREIDKSRSIALNGLLSSFPISDFLSRAETYRQLGVSKQAFHKNKRISRGFIYQYAIGRDMFYLKQSIEMYKSTGDGRFPLHQDMYAQYESKIIPFDANWDENVSAERPESVYNDNLRRDYVREG